MEGLCLATNGVENGLHDLHGSSLCSGLLFANKVLDIKRHKVHVQPRLQLLCHLCCGEVVGCAEQSMSLMSGPEMQMPVLKNTTNTAVCFTKRKVS